MTIRTRFAPSPTGYLHIGGVRTALFNWLLARGGKVSTGDEADTDARYVLRIDDTDQMRNVDEALAPILDGFKWLGLNWDEGPGVDGPSPPYFQSGRVESHRAAAMELLTRGAAYRDYARPEELADLRKEAESRKERFFYDRRFMAADDAAAKAYEADGRSATIRLKMPRQGECVIDDLVRGEVRVAWAGEQDHVILRADGSPIYHLASAIDDHHMGITHVVRAEEHLSNTPRQVFIFEALGYDLPRFAHLPYVAEPGGTAKLSKRKLAKYIKNPDFKALLDRGQAIAARRGRSVQDETFNPVIIDFYRDIGFDAPAILNYLVLLGWSLDGETERFTVDEMIDSFSLDRVGKAPASFDPQKLLSFQADYFASLSIDQRVDRIRPFVHDAGWDDTHLHGIVAAADDRLKIAGDIYEFDYLFVDDYDTDAKAYDKRIRGDENAKAHLTGLRDSIAAGDISTVDNAKAAVNDYLESTGVKLGKVVHALRIATTGRGSGFGMFDTLAILGQDRVLERIDRTLETID